jgi:hypothetical protein
MALLEPAGPRGMLVLDCDGYTMMVAVFTLILAADWVRKRRESVGFYGVSIFLAGVLAFPFCLLRIFT